MLTWFKAALAAAIAAPAVVLRLGGIHLSPVPSMLVFGPAVVASAFLLSSKVNQWTLLVGSLPVAYAVGGSAAGGIVLDARQTEEFILTAAQTLLGLAVLVDLRFAHWEAIALFVLFALQFPFPQPAVRLALAAGYTAIALVVLVRRRAEIPKIVRAALAGRR